MSKDHGTTKRLVKGTTVMWLRVGIGMVAQILTTPFYLHYWSAETYGAWLAVLAAVSVLQIPGTSFQTYIGFDLMRDAAQDKPKFSVLLRSAVRLGGLYGLFELFVAFVLSITVIPFALGGDAQESLRSEVAQAFVYSAIGSGLVWNWGGMWVRGASAVGYYARGAWWGVADGLVRVIVPLLVLPFGFNMAEVALVFAGSVVFLHQFTLWDLRRLVRLEMDPASQPSWGIAWRALLHSQAISLKSALEMLRQQGIRLILAPLVGVADLAAFATMRTGGNAALQGLSTITNPLTPELMRFLAKRDQERSEGAMATVWLVVVALMAPAVVVLQMFVADIFSMWTRGKIPFNPLLFASISASVLVYAAAQPAVAIVRGNNLMKAQVRNSFTSAIIVVVGTLVLVPFIGLLGAGLALLLAEIVSTFGYRMVAKRWLSENGMRWPEQSSKVVSLAIVLSSVALVIISCYPDWKWWTLATFLPLICWNMVWYWRLLPPLAISRIHAVTAKMKLARS